MKIEITDDGNGAWNLIATGDDDPMPLYAAHGRSPWAVSALVRGICTDFAEPQDRRATPCARGRGDAPVDDCPCVNCSLARPDADRARLAGENTEAS